MGGDGYSNLNMIIIMCKVCLITSNIFNHCQLDLRCKKKKKARYSDAYSNASNQKAETLLLRLRLAQASEFQVYLSYTARVCLKLNQQTLFNEI